MIFLKIEIGEFAIPIYKIYLPEEKGKYRLYIKIVKKFAIVENDAISIDFELVSICYVANIFLCNRWLNKNMKKSYVLLHNWREICSEIVIRISCIPVPRGILITGVEMTNIECCKFRTKSSIYKVD